MTWATAPTRIRAPPSRPWSMPSATGCNARPCRAAHAREEADMRAVSRHYGARSDQHMHRHTMCLDSVPAPCYLPGEPTGTSAGHQDPRWWQTTNDAEDKPRRSPPRRRAGAAPVTRDVSHELPATAIGARQSCVCVRTRAVRARRGAEHRPPRASPSTGGSNG